MRPAHRWDLSPAQARALQDELRGLVCLEDALPSQPNRIAGVDVGYEDGGRTARAAVALLDYPSLGPVTQIVVRTPVRFPYVPGLLSFREAPAILSALAELTQTPDLILVDGQGYAHPRRMGIACHLGLLTGLPTIGVGKTRLVGTHGEPPAERGGWCPLIHHDEIIGAVLRTRVGVKPLYISPGHRICLDTAIRWVLACTPRYRLPEPIRCAHRLASGPAI